MYIFIYICIYICMYKHTYKYIPIYVHIFRGISVSLSAQFVEIYNENVTDLLSGKGVRTNIYMYIHFMYLCT
jgi:hypothetical protein